MENIYIVIVALLFCLAAFDLIVGVSNDAVNFLNSALGSKAARWKTIMIVASLGILIGAVSSGGMMEVARKGIFNPHHFYFNEIMVLFLAVMITDIIMLDLFNTFAMPTSTTVSVVFEILGASIAISVIKVIDGGLPMNYLFNNDNPAEGIIGYMNWEKAGQIISGILLSVLFAFTLGAIVQFIARFLFSFQYEKRLKFIGSFWAGLSLTSILYFLIFKGMGGIVKGVDKGSMTTFQQLIYQFYDLIKTNTIEFLVISVLVLSVVMFVLQLFKVNSLKIIVLFGTFALAMAFAGNDLVNFIGVPIAGWQSFNLWVESGVDPNELLMTAMSGKVATPYFLLALAGIIMTLTLWFSKKARSVTETEINLGAQSEIDERFKPNFFARAIVNGTSFANNIVKKIMPKTISDKIEKKFTMPVIEISEGAAHFDMVRASVNLVMASVLIAIATEMKLPLSTTYVSFMVAMGASLADRAWGRESAVYRVAGVLNVIGGWFLTAILASSAAAIFATIMYFGGITAIIALVGLVIFSIYKTSRLHKKSLKKKMASEAKIAFDHKDVNETLQFLSENVYSSIDQIKRTLEYTHLGVIGENKSVLQKANDNLDQLNEDYGMVKNGLFKIIKKNKSTDTISSHLYVLTYDLMQDILQSLTLIVDSSTQHVQNNHKPFSPEQCDQINEIKQSLVDYLEHLKEVINTKNFNDISELLIRKTNFLKLIESSTSDQIKGIMEKQYGFKNSSLYFTLLLEMKDLAAIAFRFVKLYAKIFKEGKL